MKLPTQFAIFGSHDSEDLDVMYFVDELPTLQECKRLAAQLEAQHQSTKEVDVNLCVVKDCHVVTTYKGTVDEVNNMLHYTTNMHVQPSTFPEIKAMDRNIRSNKSMQNYAHGANCVHLNSCFIDRHCSMKNCNLPSLCFGDKSPTTFN